jgi:hypothetical protein
LWQLTSGWYGIDTPYRWIQPDATARLRRPAEAQRFEVVVNVGPVQIRDLGRVELEVSLDGRRLGSQRFTTNGWQTARWNLTPSAPGGVVVRFHVEPAFRPTGADRRTLGAAIVSFGFLPREGT